VSTTVQTGTTLTFDRFWRWLHQHRNCLLRVGAADAFLYDQEDSHWQLEEDGERNPIVQLCRGKSVLGEVVMDVREVLFVQSTPENEGEQATYVFELVGGPKGEAYTLYHFVLAHAFEEEEGQLHRPSLKH
jgi:hypothetical protein